MNKHCFYCSTRSLKTVCPLQGAEYLIKQSQTTEDRFFNSILKEVLIRHLKDAPADYICLGECSNSEQMLNKVIQEKEQVKDATYRLLHLLNESKSLNELENKLPNSLIKGSQPQQWKIKVNSDCFIEFIWKDGHAYEVDIVDQQGQIPLWLEWVVEEMEKEVKDA